MMSFLQITRWRPQLLTISHLILKNKSFPRCNDICLGCEKSKQITNKKCYDSLSLNYLLVGKHLWILWFVLTKFLLLITDCEHIWQELHRRLQDDLCSPQRNIYANIKKLDLNKGYGRLSIHYWLSLALKIKKKNGVL